MSIDTRTEAASKLEKAKGELRALSRTTEDEIELVARVFEGLAGHTETILNLAAAIVGCVENESVSSALEKVQILGAAARRFIGDRLQATAGILETVTREVELLRDLSYATRCQAAIALETKALSVLTNIEVARLGAVGAGFQYLAHQLADFSKSVTAEAQKLAGQADGRTAAIEETRRVLAAQLPCLRGNLARIEVDLGNALAAVDSSLTQLARMPVQFRTCVEEVAQQIAGVVAAVQAHDITRQQIEHVQEAFALIATRIRSDGNPENEAAQAIAQAYAGLTIQIYQLRFTKQTLASWASQIRTCVGGILRVSASDVVGIAPLVLEQEQGLSSQLVHIERLERESQGHSDRIQRTFGGISDLMQLVTDYMQKSKSVRDHLQLLTVNAIIQASGLGTQAAAILAIAESIKGISAAWSHITDQSGRTMQEVLALEKQTNEEMGAFSETTSERLREAQDQTTTGLDNLRTAATFAAQRAQEMKAATEKMHAETTEVGEAVDLLAACFERIDVVLAELEAVRRQLEIDDPEVKERYDAAEVERLFSAFYTTEAEREVLHAALRGSDLPVAQPTFEGNSVELF